MAPSVTASSGSQRHRRAGTDDPVARLLASGHARMLLEGPEAPATAGRLAAEIRRRGRSRCRRVGSLLCKAILLYTLYNASSYVFFGQFPAVWQFLQNTDSFARAELVYNQITRRITVGLGLHGYGSLQAMERVQCMLPNPMYTRPLLCCPCDKHKLIKAASSDGLRKGFDRLFDRMVSPFIYPNNSQPGLDYPALRALVISQWSTIDDGPNRVGALLLPSGPHSEASAPNTLEQLFRPNDAKPPTAPPSDSATYWLFGHLPAIRALRDTVRRPDHVPHVLGFMSDCYWVSATKTSGWQGYVVLYFGSVYNGLHPIESSGARPGKNRKTEKTVKDKEILKDKMVGKDEKISGKDGTAVKDKKVGKDEKTQNDVKVGNTEK